MTVVDFVIEMPDNYPNVSNLKIVRLGYKMAKQAYTRAGVVEMTRVLAAISKPGQERFKAHGASCAVTSLRLQNFAKSQTCISCGLQAKFFAVEENGSGWHLNLYGVSATGEEVLFTHDHTLARSLGGSDTPENTTTMCSPCNRAKSIGEYVEVCKRRGLPAPGSRRQRREALVAKSYVCQPGTAVRKISGRQFQSGRHVEVIVAHCSSLLDRNRSLSYVFEGDNNSIVAATKCLAAK